LLPHAEDSGRVGGAAIRYTPDLLTLTQVSTGSACSAVAAPGVNRASSGYGKHMTDHEPLDLGTTELSEAEEARVRREHDLDRPEVFDRRNDVDRRARTRANLLPEELATGSADAEAQAREVLRDSDVRTEIPESAPDTMVERRESDD
jgi:hypothetical protein